MKNVWAFYIGHLIIAMNEIDFMMYRFHSDIFGKEASKTFAKKTLSEKLKSISKGLSEDDPLHKAMKDLIEKTLELCDIRNLVAHRPFALDLSSPIKPGDEPKLIPIAPFKFTEDQIKVETQNCIKLSDAISRCIAQIQMQSPDCT